MNADELLGMTQALDEMAARLALGVRDMQRTTDAVYHERNQLVAVLSRLYTAHLARHQDDDIEWEDAWRWVVCVHSPAGQLTWHIHDSELPLFAHLYAQLPEPRSEDVWNDWDGHTSAEKYQRLAHLP